MLWDTNHPGSQAVSQLIDSETRNFHLTALIHYVKNKRRLDQLYRRCSPPQCKTSHPHSKRLRNPSINDPTMADLVDGQFQVVGKVIRVINDSTESVSLLRKAAVGAMNEQVLEPIFQEFGLAVAAGNIELPRIEWKIAGPVIQVIPVAIFA
jgi:hypothetical protein